MRRTLRFSILSGCVALALIALPSSAGAQEPAAEPTESEQAPTEGEAQGPAEGEEEPVFGAPRLRGEEAINALGDRLPAVAAKHGRTAGAFENSLRADDTLWVDDTGRLLYIEPEPDPRPESVELAEAASDEALTTYPLSETFLLHSDPGAQRVIFLDFDGHDASGTEWDRPGYNPLSQPYDLNGNSAVFDDQERTNIQSIWLRVAEDFAPFGVDVTTEDPGFHAIHRTNSNDQEFGTRVVVTPTNVINCNCGGVAYVGVFNLTGNNHSRYQPAWVFTATFGDGPKLIAEAATHEAGHNLGLSHDGRPGQAYFAGHGDWAPIMGVGYDRPITQWSKGEYNGATNTEDDLARMPLFGIPVRADDHLTGNGATPLVGPDVDVTGIITTRTDIDGFRFDTAGGTVDIRVDPAPHSPNLDLILVLREFGGPVITTNNPSSAPSQPNDLTIGFDAAISVPVPAGSYEIRVDGRGFGDPATNGYSDYSSLGRYRLSGTIPGLASENQAPTALAAATTTPGSNDVALDGTGSSDPDDDPLTYVWSVDGTEVATGATTTWTAPGFGTYDVTLTVDDGELDDADTISVTTVAGTAPSAPTDVTVVTDVDDSALITWTDTADNEDRFDIIRKRRLDTGKFGEWTQVATLFTPDLETWNDNTAVSGSEYQYQVKAVNAFGQGRSGYSASWFAPADTSPPSAPTGVTVVTDVDDSALITWTDTADNEDRFDIIRKRRLDTGKFGEWTQVATLFTPDLETWNDNTAVSGSEYQYQVKAVNAFGQGRSGYSASWFAP